MSSFPALYHGFTQRVVRYISVEDNEMSETRLHVTYGKLRVNEQLSFGDTISTYLKPPEKIQKYIASAIPPTEKHIGAVGCRFFWLSFVVVCIFGSLSHSLHLPLQNKSKEGSVEKWPETNQTSLASTGEVCCALIYAAASNQNQESIKFFP